MVAQLAPTTLVRARHLAFVPDDVQRMIDSFNPRTLLGASVKRSLAYLPRDLAEELLDAIRRSVIMESSLAVVHLHGPHGARPFQCDDYGIVSRKVITDAGVAYLVDDFDNASGSADVSNFNYHGIGTGTTAEAAGDTALVTESTTALNPDSTRATGTRSQPAANQFRSVGTLTADNTIAATEHGLFTQAATGGGTLWDRSVFTAVNLASADSIQTTYTVTVSSGG